MLAAPELSPCAAPVSSVRLSVALAPVHHGGLAIPFSSSYSRGTPQEGKLRANSADVECCEVARAPNTRVTL